MLVVYDSKTGNVERFVKKLHYPAIKIVNSLIVSEPYVLITFTTGFGKVPESTENFLKVNHSNLMAVASSGNMNWGNLFAHAATLISEKYNVPTVHRFELSGTENDVYIFNQEVERICHMHQNGFR